MRNLMLIPHTIVRSLFLVVLVLMFSGCGGGGASSVAGVTPVGGITGVAASGAPIVLGTVSLKDSSNPSINRTTTTAADGSFVFNTAELAGLKAPFIITITNGANTYYSIATTANGISNVNPLTTMVTSVAAGGADLPTLYNSWPSAASAAATQNLTTADTAVQTALAPILTQFGVTGSLINSPFAADHTGADAMLDVIDITVSAGPASTITLTNISNKLAIPLPVILNATPAASIIATPALTAASITVLNIPAVPVLSNGVALYQANCVGCHGDINNATIIGRSTVARIMGAIAANFGGMSAMGVLSPQDIQAISDAIPLTPAAPVVPVAPGALTGDVLYANNCAGCHGPLATSAKLGMTIVRLQNGISTRPVEMGRFATMSPVDMQAIVTALNAVAPPPPPPVGVPLDGAALYATNCSGCHGPLATSTKKGLTLARFTAATTTNLATTGMTSAANLGIAEIQAIISVMPPLPVDGPSLYATKCSSCHGVLASSFKGGATVARINAGIAANPAQMGTLGLTANEITLIAGALAGIAPPVVLDGPGLYAANCSNCHGPLATSAKGGATVARINAGITANPVPMGGFASSLTAAQITLIANSLAAIAPPAAPLTGSALYAANCEGCHGVLATSAKGGATVARINAGILANPAQMGGFNGPVGAPGSLTAAQIQLIATSLAAVAPPAVALDGPGLYAANCQGCHGALATSAKGGATAARINAGIAANTVQMGGFAAGVPTTGLTAAQVNLIAGALATVAPPVVALDGQGLYDANCAGCHGAFATSAKAGPSMSVARIQSGIAANSGMTVFGTSLTVPQLTLISNALAALPAPVMTGPQLYAANCASCHNPLATSSKGGATAAKIQQEITNKRGAVLIGGVLTGGMGAANLVALTPLDVASIAAALAPIAPPVCGSCHAVTLATAPGNGHKTHTTKPRAPLLTMFQGVNSCATCHGAGYSTTTNNVLTHNDGMKTVAVNTTGVAAANPAMTDAAIKWIASVVNPTTGAITTRGSCAPACHSPAGAKRNW